MTNEADIVLRVGLPTDYLRQIILGIADYARGGDWRFIEPFWQPRRMSEPLPARCDGVIVSWMNQRETRLIEQHGIATVSVAGSSEQSPFPRVVPDNLEIGRRAALHLLDRGLRRFAYCGYAGNYWSTQRRNGFEQVLREAGRTCDVFEAGDNCQPALADWLSGLKTPVGVLGGNDVRAVDVIHAAAGLGLRVPQHVVVLGVDNSELICDFMNPTLSSVDSRPARIGYEAAALLDRILGGDTAPAETRIEPAGVIARQSTDMLAVADPLVAEAVRRVRAGATTGAPLDALLAEIPMSRSTIERRFKETIGRTPGAEVRRIRVERARQLLLETSLPLKQVARRSGFSTARHMSEAFRRDLDARPTDYRKPPHD